MEVVTIIEKTKTTVDDLPNELFFEVIQYVVTLADYRNIRLVSQKWKVLVSYALKNRFQLVYPLTSSTLYSTSELTENPFTLDIYSLSGKEHHNAWSSPGVEQLLEDAESLQISGSKIEVDELKKILTHAKEGLKTLSFQCTEKNFIYQFVGIPERFVALSHLSIGYYCRELDNDTFNNFTSGLDRWTSAECTAELPSLEKLTLRFDGRGTTWRFTNLQSEDLFRNYLAIGKVLLKYKQTLRDVAIERVFRRGVQFITREQHRQEWTARRRGLEALGELRLNRLKISTTDDNRRRSRPSEFEAYGTPSNLNDVLFEMLIGPLNNVQMLTAILTSFNNFRSNYLASVRIGLVLTENIDPVLAIDLGGFRTCGNLRELHLRIIPKRQPGHVVVRNLEALPRGISSLRLETNKELRYNVAKQLLLNKLQIRWICQNLHQLESFRACLAIQGVINADVQNQQAQRINDVENMDLDTFRQLIAMPELKYMLVDMIRAGALATIISRNWIAARTTPFTELSDIQEYTDLCQAAGLKTKITPTSNLGFSAFGYVKVAIQKN